MILLIVLIFFVCMITLCIGLINSIDIMKYLDYFQRLISNTFITYIQGWENKNGAENIYKTDAELTL